MLEQCLLPTANLHAQRTKLDDRLRHAGPNSEVGSGEGLEGRRAKPPEPYSSARQGPMERALPQVAVTRAELVALMTPHGMLSRWIGA